MLGWGFCANFLLVSPSSSFPASAKRNLYGKIRERRRKTSLSLPPLPLPLLLIPIGKGGGGFPAFKGKIDSLDIKILGSCNTFDESIKSNGFFSFGKLISMIETFLQHLWAKSIFLAIRETKAPCDSKIPPLPSFLRIFCGNRCGLGRKNEKKRRRRFFPLFRSLSVYSHLRPVSHARVLSIFNFKYRFITIIFLWMRETTIFGSTGSVCGLHPNPFN